MPLRYPGCRPQYSNKRNVSYVQVQLRFEYYPTGNYNTNRRKSTVNFTRVRIPSLRYNKKMKSEDFIFCGAVKGIRTPMVSHTDLNRARLPIPPRPHIHLFSLPNARFIILPLSPKSKHFFHFFINILIFFHVFLSGCWWQGPMQIPYSRTSTCTVYFFLSGCFFHRVDTSILRFLVKNAT